MNDRIGEAAGKICEHLKNHGPASSLKLKLSLNMTSSEIFLALGWLCREGKMQISPHAEGVWVQPHEI